jgi:hypothetical protein
VDECNWDAVQVFIHALPQWLAGLGGAAAVLLRIPRLQ